MLDRKYHILHPFLYENKDSSYKQGRGMNPKFIYTLQFLFDTSAFYEKNYAEIRVKVFVLFSFSKKVETSTNV